MSRLSRARAYAAARAKEKQQAPAETAPAQQEQDESLKNILDEIQAEREKLQAEKDAYAGILVNGDPWDPNAIYAPTARVSYKGNVWAANRRTIAERPGDGLSWQWIEEEKPEPIPELVQEPASEPTPEPEQELTAEPERDPAQETKPAAEEEQPAPEEPTTTADEETTEQTTTQPESTEVIADGNGETTGERSQETGD